MSVYSITSLSHASNDVKEPAQNLDAESNAAAPTAAIKTTFPLKNDGAGRAGRIALKFQSESIEPEGKKPLMRFC